MTNITELEMDLTGAQEALRKRNSSVARQYLARYELDRRTVGYEVAGDVYSRSGDHVEYLDMCADSVLRSLR